ncbi:hypothetical protein [Virgibacillus kimchii]
MKIRGGEKIYLLLFTIIYCVITQVLNIGYLLAWGIYLIGLGLVKGFLSEELKDVFNFRETKFLYERYGFKDSLMELLSLILIFINSYLIDYVPFTPFEFVFMFFVIAIVYRFLFWGITQTIRKRIVQG